MSEESAKKWKEERWKRYWENTIDLICGLLALAFLLILVSVITLMNSPIGTQFP